MKSYRIPEKLLNEIDDFSIFIEKKLKDEIDPIQFRAKRVSFGIYEQRINDTYMIRIRCPGGIITPKQMKVVADLAKKYGSGRIHITTRQEIQIHSVEELSKIPEILKELYSVNLSTRGGGGNTVRNIVAPAESGIVEDEVFDVSPFAVALTSLMIKDDDSWNLPRKFKINFSSKIDNGFARIADVGFIAKEKNGEKGFEVYAAGGMGVKSDVAKKLLDFIPENEAGCVATALKKLFFDHGNRKNRHQARLRFLWNKIGEKSFGDLFEKYYIEVKEKKDCELELFSLENKCENDNVLIEKLRDDEKSDFYKWKEKFTFKQKQKDLYAIRFPLLLGDIEANLFHKLASFLSNYGENIIRFTTMQNILVRNISEKYLVNFYHFYKEYFNEVPYFSDSLTVCAGADTCKLGLCLSRELAKVILFELEKEKENLNKLPVLRISGCPNSCGQHWLADLGFYGFAARKGERLYPAYYVLGCFENSKETFKLAEKIGEISARDLPAFVRKILLVYQESSHSNFRDFLHNERTIIEKELSSYSVPEFKVDRNYYYDWGSEEIFSLASRSTGECSAGFFDFIERDLAKIDESKGKVLSAINENELIENLIALSYYSSRMLLITRGIEAENLKDVVNAFVDNFIHTGYIDEKYKPILEKVVENDRKIILESKEEILSLSEDVKKLYDSMDTNFQFNIERRKKDEVKKEPQVINRFKDLRGVACPMNFVKTKLELSFLKSGDILEIYLDEGEPIQNVPGSLKGEGHTILSIEKKDGYYSVVIKKG